jgi:hypothetical protein
VYTDFRAVLADQHVYFPDVATADSKACMRRSVTAMVRIHRTHRQLALAARHWWKEEDCSERQSHKKSFQAVS